MKIVESIVSLLIMMSFGFFFRKRGVLNDKMLNGISYLLLNLTLPCLIIVVMQTDFSPELAIESFICIGVPIAAVLAGFFVGLVLSRALRLDPPASRIYAFGMAFPNVAYMGYPVIGQLYGDMGVFYVTMCNISFTLLTFTFGLRIQAGKGTGFSFKSLLSPACVASLAGFVMFLLSVKLWGPFASSLRTVGNMTTPLSMLFVGAMLAKADIKTVLLDYKPYLMSAVKLLIMPVIVFFALKPLLGTGQMLTVLSLLIGMPAATVTAILAQNCGGDTVTASKTVFVSTVLSALSLPLIMLIVG